MQYYTLYNNFNINTEIQEFVVKYMYFIQLLFIITWVYQHIMKEMFVYSVTQFDMRCIC